MGVIDKYKFEHRSRSGCSNSDYHLAQTTCCDNFIVEDVEIGTLFVEPHDLTKTIEVYDDTRLCPFCGFRDWQWLEVQNLKEVPEQWRWACVEK